MNRIEIDLTAIEANVRVIREVLAARSARIVGGAETGPRATPPTAVCAVLKADAYGLGAPRIAKRLAIAGVEMLAVYSPEQARALIDSAITAPILLLMPVHDMDRGDALYRAASRGQLQFTIHDRQTFECLLAISEKLGLALSTHLYVDTGLCRGGSDPDEAAAILAKLSTTKRLTLAGVFNHLASPECDGPHTQQQSERFSAWIERHRTMIPREALIHEANTAGLFRSEIFHRSMVRVGAALLGYASELFTDEQAFEFAGDASRLMPAVRWLSELVQIRRVPAGSGVGYGSTWRASRPSVLGLVPAGYADGYPRALSNQALMGVILRSGIKAFVPVVGRVSMDQLTIDLTDLPEDQVGLGSMVEVFGNDRSAPNHVPLLARKAGTIVHELLCRLSARLPRHYLAVEQPTVKPGSLSMAV